MAFDGATLIAATAFVAVMSGVLLLVVEWQYRDTAAAALWGIGNLFAALTLFLMIDDFMSTTGLLCGLVAAGLSWSAAAKFRRWSLPTVVLTGGAILGIIIEFVPIGMNEALRVGLLMLLVAAFLTGCAADLAKSRGEQLRSLGPLMFIVAAHGFFVVLGAISIFVGYAPDEIDPGPVLVPMLIETLLYVVGSTFFLAALIRERAIAAERRAARIDSLTGLPNRGAFVLAAEPRLAAALAAGKPVAGVLFDLDSFKKVNDTFGHRYGDVVIQRFAATLQRLLRRDDLVGRLGGEEFGLLMPGAGIDAALALAERIRVGFAEDARWVDGQLVNATVSAGIALAEKGSSLNALLDTADRELYVAKRLGRNQVHVAAREPVRDGDVVIRIA